MTNPTEEKPPPSPPERILQALSLGVDEVTAAQQAGVDYPTYLQWMEAGRGGDPKWIDFYQAARSLIPLATTLDLTRIAGASGLDWKAAAWRYENVTRPRPNLDAERVQAEQAAVTLPKPVPKKSRPKKLESLAGDAGFGGVYADLRNAEPPLTPEQAFFVGWYMVYRSNREVLKLVPGMPTTIKAMERFLGVSNTTLHTWKAKYTRELGLESWLDDKLAGMIPLALNRLEQNILNPNGGISNQAIRLAIELYQSRRAAAKADPDDKPPAHSDPNQSINELSGEELDAVTENLVFAAAGEAGHLEEVTFEEAAKPEQPHPTET